MFHIGRCGSTVLGQLLNQHPRIYWASELYSPIFYRWQKANAGVETVGCMPVDAIHYLTQSMRAARHRHYGFEMKPFHFRLIGYSVKSYLDHLDSLGFSHYVLLDRRNRLRKVVSSLIAHERGRPYHIGRRSKAKLNRIRIEVDNVRIDFDQKPLVEYLADYEVQIESLKAALDDNYVLSLTYEEDIRENPVKAYFRVCDFIGVQPEKASIKLSRTNPFPLEAMVENLDEVRESLRGTPYERMLED